MFHINPPLTRKEVSPMEATVNYLKEEATQMELCSFIREGLQDIYYNRLLDSDTVFNQLEERYHTNE
jgi:hypothetical protein